MFTSDGLFGHALGRATAALVAVLWVVTSLVVPPMAQAADGQLTVTKSVDRTTVDPGEPVLYTIELSCSAIQTSCISPVLTDVLPPEFVVTTNSLPTDVPGVVDYEFTPPSPGPGGGTFTARFLSPLPSPPAPAGSVGLLGGTTQQIKIPVQFPQDSTVAGGTPVRNTAVFTASNAPTVESSVTVEVNNPPTLLPVGDKNWVDGSAIAGTAEPSTIELKVRNNSKLASVTALSITDLDPDTFEHFNVRQLGPVRSWPAGSDRVRIQYCTTGITTGQSADTCTEGQMLDGGTYLRSAGNGPFTPPGLDLATVTGVRFTFLSPDGVALANQQPSLSQVDLGLVLRETLRSSGQPINEIGTRIDVANTATPSLVATQGSTVGEPATASYAIQPPVLKSVTTKAYCAAPSGFACPNPEPKVFAGQGNRVLVDVRAKDDSGFNVAGMTITEPSASDPNAQATFATIDVSAVRVELPAGAASATVTATCQDSSTNSVTWGGTDIPASTLCPDSLPSSVSVAFAGTNGGSTIVAGSNGRLLVVGTLNAKATAKAWSNCASSALSNPTNGVGSGASTACDSLTVSRSTLKPTTSKQFFSDTDGDFAADGTAFAGQGSGVGMSIQGTNTSGFPVDQMVNTEPNPGDPTSVANFAKVDATTVRVTPPAGTTGAELTVLCRGGGTAIQTLANSGTQVIDLTASPAACPGGFPASVSVTYTGDLPNNAVGTLDLVGTLNAGATAGDLLNCAATTLTNAGSPGPVTMPGCATLTVQSAELSSTTTKTFCGGTDPSCPTTAPPVVAGQGSAVTMRVTGNNTSPLPVSTLTIIEPSPGNASAKEAFGAVDAASVRVTIPAGATSTTVTATCRAGTSTPQTITGQAGTTQTVGALCDGGLPASITVTFTGSLAPLTSGVLDIVGTANGNAAANNALENCADTIVARPGSSEDESTGCANLTPIPNVVTANAEKIFRADSSLDFGPDGQIVAGQGGGVVMAISATNTSAFGIDSMTITEPSPTNTAFQFVDAVRIRVTPPATTTTTTLTLTCNGTQTRTLGGATQVIEVASLCGTTPPTSVSVEYVGTIASGSKGKLEITGTLDPETPGTSLPNCAQVDLDGPGNGQDLSTEACGTLPILPNVLAVSGTKTFCVDADASFGCDSPAGTAIAGQASGVLLQVQGKNTTRFPVSSLAITDPEPGNASASAAFAAVDVTSVRITPPAGTTKQTVRVTCRVGAAPADTVFTDGNLHTLPNPCSGSFPATVSVTFEGTIARDASGTLAMVGRLNAAATAGELRNCAEAVVTGTADPARDTACATLPIVEPRIEIDERVKTASAEVIVPGQALGYSLSFRNAGNIPVTGVVVDDPVNPTPVAEPFRFVRLASVSTPSTPASTVQVYDPTVSGYVAYDPADQALLARALGLRVTVTGTLPPSDRFAFSYQVLLRDEFTPDPDEPNDLAFDNCAVVGVGTTTFEPFCSGEVAITSGSVAASVNKTFNPSSLPRPFPGDTTPAATTDLQVYAKNTGDLNLSKMVVTDIDADFWAAYQVADANAVRVNLPPGADRVRLDVCTSAANCANGTFTLGALTAATNPVPLPAGVAADQVWGLRVTFTRADGRYLLTPVPPTEQPPTGNGCVNNSLCVRVRPLATLRPGGELAPASVENTIQAGIRSIRQDQGDPNALFPLPDTSATVRLTQQDASMDIDKDPNTRLSPGSIAPFTLVIENTGRAIIPDLLVTDPIPAELEFYQPAGVVPYSISYVLPDGTPPAAVGEPAFSTRTEAVGGISRVSEVSWAWPNWGFVPGAKVTITFQVKLAAGVPADTVVRNTASVTSRPGFPFMCKPDNNTDDGESIVDGRKFCTSWAEITALAGNSFDGTKWVAGDDALGFRNTFTNSTEPTDATSCPRLVVEGRAYTHFPCVALNNPGQPFTYLLRLTNSGNTADVTQIQLLDTLPVIGDKGVLLNTQARGTGWEPRPALLGAPAGQNAGTVTTEYTTSDTAAQSICFDTWGPNNPPPLPSSCTPAEWTPGFTPTATAFRSDLDFGRTDPLSPGESALVRFDVDSPLALTDPASYAWNSYAFQVGFFPRNAPSGAQIQYLTPTEPIQAGIGILYGALEVTKAVVNPPPGVDLGTFPIEYECTTTIITPTGSADVVVTGGTLKVSAGQTVPVPGALPAGATCRVWETDSKGAQSPQLGEANAVTVTIMSGEAPDGSAKPPQNVTVTNTYNQGYLQLTKALTGPGVQFVDDTTPFVFDVGCGFRGQPLTGYSPRTVTLTPANPDSDVLGPLPVGAQCIVAERPPYGGADGPAVLTPAPAVGGYPITEGGADEPLEVTATNTFSVGPLVLTKNVANEGVDPKLIPELVFPLVFPFEVTCEQRLVDGTFRTLPGYPKAEELSFTRAEVPGIGAPSVTKRLTVDTQLPVGARCWGVELDSAGATVVAVVPETAQDAVVVAPPATPGGDVAEITIEATNTYQAGAIFIRKVVTGDGAEFAKEPFVFDVVCRNAAGVVVVEPFTLTIKPPKRSAGLGELPSGALCTVTERAPYGGADGPATLAPDGPYKIPVRGEFPVTAEATNTFSSGSLTVVKALDGAAQDVAAGFTFTMQVTCTRQLEPGGPVVTVLDRTVTLKGGERSDPQGPLPIGAVCTVVETDDGGATSTSITPSPVTITLDEQDATVTATNTYEEGQLTLRKVVTGPGAQFADRPFTFRVACTFRGQSSLIPDRTVTIKPEKPTATIAGIPVGADCAVKELAPYGGADGPAVISPESVVIPRLDDEQVDVIATNTFSVGSLTVSKVVDGPAAAEVSATRVFDLKVTCTREGPNGPVRFLTETASLNGGESASYGGLPIGAVCQVTEPNVQGATSTVITPKSVEVTLKEPRVSIVAANTYQVGDLRIQKAITGAGAQFATRAFTFNVACTFQGTSLAARTATIVPPAPTVTVSGLPTGASCSIVETGTGGADGPAAVTPATVTIGDSTTVDVQATNTFSTARIDVSKVVVGEGDGPYTFLVACTWTVAGRAVRVPLPGGGVLTLDDGDQGGFAVPAPSTCAVTETDVPDDAEVTISESGDIGTGSATDGTVTLAAVGDEAAVEVTNTFPPLGPTSDKNTDKTGGEIASTGAIMGYLPVGLLALLLGGLLVRWSRRRIS